MTRLTDLWRHEQAARASRAHSSSPAWTKSGAARWPARSSPPASSCRTDFDLDGINDSKKLTERQRERADERIRREALAVGLGTSSADDD